MSSARPTFLFSLSAYLLVSSAAGAGISEKAKGNFAAIDALGVEKHWPAGVHVNWVTGVPDGVPEKSQGKHTHCSAFAAAAAERLGIYLLRPPEHGQVLLANAQADWLRSAAGKNAGWSALADGTAAQEAANVGFFVLAVYKNRKPKVPGHVAIVRPSAKSIEDVRRDGPEITQAGLRNHEDTTLVKGFADHRIALREHLIEFYRHEVR